jgi:YVTN family beta-propeller protein
MDVGRAPVDLALKPDGGEIFVSNSLSDSVSEIYNTTDEVGDTYMIGADPVRGLVSRDNALLYVANQRSQEVTVYSIDDGKRASARVHVGDGPCRHGIFRRRAFAVCRRQPFGRRRRGAHRNAVAVHHAPRRPRPQRHCGQGVQGAVHVIVFGSIAYTWSLDRELIRILFDSAS